MSVSSKRRKVSPASAGNDSEDAVRSIISSETDLEILLHQGIAQTLEWRIKLGETLQQILLDEPSAFKGGWQEFRETALEACSAIDEPVKFIFNPSLPKPTPIAPKPPPAAVERTVRKFNPKPKFLFTRPSAASSSFQVLQCQTCKRTVFSSLQGLLNHSRLAHNVQFPSHDECIALCAIWPDSCEGTFQLEDGLQVGSGSGSSVRGLKRLFEEAVGISGAGPTGIDTNLTGLATPESKEYNDISSPLLLSREPSHVSTALAPPEPAASSYITKTLGHHVDTPALAPFLGRDGFRSRCIQTYEEDVSVDIDGLGAEPTTRPQRGWGSATRGQTLATEYLDTEGLPLPAESEPISAPSKDDPGTSVGTASNNTNSDATTTGRSRFHFTARLLVSDHSLWVPYRAKYRWMISLDSPAYSTHLSAFVTSFRVAPSTNEATSSIIPKDDSRTGACFSYPFHIVGWTSSPFLAKLEISTIGPNGEEGKENKVWVEHWVDTDPIKSGSQIIGDEQILDVELDKGTVLRDAVPVDERERLRGKLKWDSSVTYANQTAHTTTNDAIEGKISDKEEPYVVALKDLAEMYPMTLKGHKPQKRVQSNPRRKSTRSSTPLTATATVIAPQQHQHQIHYQPVVSPAVLNSMIMGRRKAVEWARASTIHTAYEARYNSGISDDALIPLSKGDVYAWLEDEGHFSSSPVPAKAHASSVSQRKTPGRLKRSVDIADEQRWCAVCGILKNFHPQEENKARESRKYKQQANSSKRSKVAGRSPAEDGADLRSIVQVKTEPLEDELLGGAPQAQIKNPPLSNISPSAGPTWECDILPSSIHDFCMRRTPMMVDVEPLLQNATASSGGLDPVKLTDTLAGHYGSPQRVNGEVLSMRSFKRQSDMQALVHVVEPFFALSVERLVSRFSPALPTFHHSSSVINYNTNTTVDSLPCFQTNHPPNELNASIAPYALLALCTRSFARALVRNGVDVANADLHTLTSRSGYRKRSAAVEMSRILTPGHILRGLLPSDTQQGYSLQTLRYPPHPEVTYLSRPMSVNALKVAMEVVCRPLGTSRELSPTSLQACNSSSDNEESD